MVGLQSVILGEPVVRASSLAQLIDMRSSVLVVFLCVDAVDLGELWLNRLLPVCLANFLCLFNAWSTVLGTVDLGWTNDVLIDNVIVWLCRLDVWVGVFLVVWGGMWQNRRLEVEVWLADLWRGVGDILLGCRTSEENGDDRVPCKKSTRG